MTSLKTRLMSLVLAAIVCAPVAVALTAQAAKIVA